jgi:hypothetical protein
MTGGTTEGDVVHIGDTAIASDSDDHEVNRGGDDNNIQPVRKTGS